MLHRLARPLQRADVNFIERDVPIMVEKSLRLRFSCFVEVGIYARALHNAQSVEVCFAVANQVDCFIDRVGSTLQQREQYFF